MTFTCSSCTNRFKRNPSIVIGSNMLIREFPNRAIYLCSGECAFKIISKITRREVVMPVITWAGRLSVLESEPVGYSKQPETTDCDKILLDNKIIRISNPHL